LSDRAIFLGFVDLKTFGWRSSALLRRVTLADHRRFFEDFFAFVLMAVAERKKQGPPLFLPLREPIPPWRDQWSNLAYYIVSREAEDARVFFLVRAGIKIDKMIESVRLEN